MTISLIRVDNRLIHGQVVQGWLPTLKVDEVVVVSSQAAKSNLMSKMLRMALPNDYKLQIVDPKEAGKYLLAPQDTKAFVLVEEFSSLGDMMQEGIPLNTVNIGNTKYEDGKKEFHEGVYLTEEDVALAKNLRDKGVKFDVRAVPSALSARLL